MTTITEARQQLEALKQELDSLNADWHDFRVTERLVISISRTVATMSGGDPNVRKLNQVLQKTSAIAMSIYSIYVAAATLSASLGNPFAIAALASSSLLIVNEIMQPVW